MKKMEVYRCSHCGLQLEVTAGAEVRPPVCCGEPMLLQTANTQDAAREKHVPVLETLNDGVLVKIGAVEHPMLDEHHIEWIEIINGSYVNRFYLKPGDKPQAAFYVAKSPKLVVRASCNIHGIWQMPGKGEQA